MGVDKELAWQQVSTMPQLLSDSFSRQRFLALLLGTFAALALVLSAISTYGVIAHSVTECTREIGIRMALGATQHDVLRLVLGETMMLMLTGLVLGIVIALALTRFVFQSALQHCAYRQNDLWWCLAPDPAPLALAIMQRRCAGPTSRRRYSPVNRNRGHNPACWPAMPSNIILGDTTRVSA